MRKQTQARTLRGIASGLLVVGLLITPGTAGGANAGGVSLPTGVSDITGTAEGLRYAQTAITRFAGEGMAASVADLRVVRDQAGILVAPLNAELSPMVTMGPDGARVTEMVPVTPRDPAAAMRESMDLVPGSSTSLAAPLSFDGAYWGNPVAQACFARYSDTWSWLDHCYRDYKLQNDGDPNHDYYGLQRHGTAGANSPWVINAAVIGATQAGSVSQSWVDWNPLGSTTGNCNSSTTLFIQSPVVGLQYSVVICEQWIMNKSNPTVSYSMEWYGPGTHTTRGIAFDISVSVAQGAWPQWSMPGQSWGSAF